MQVRCPKCNSPIQKRDIFFYKKEVFCRDGCGGTTREHPELDKCELPPAKLHPRPAEHSRAVLDVNRTHNEITVGQLAGDLFESAEPEEAPES